MPVYVDNCYMIADTGEELEAMAQKLRVRKTFRHRGFYELVPSRREMAVVYGAKEISRKELALILMKREIQ